MHVWLSFLPYCDSFLPSILFVSPCLIGFYGVCLSACCGSHTAARASIISLPPTVNPLRGLCSGHFPLCHCHFLLNLFTNQSDHPSVPTFFFFSLSDGPFSASFPLHKINLHSRTLGALGKCGSPSQQQQQKFRLGNCSLGATSSIFQTFIM